ncbi:MAG: DUF255 domain-containing protein [Chitinophagaceae bacterium]|nr:MAG: DUF255 domain-containing protein [Chitinophagaceae bacterium]
MKNLMIAFLLLSGKAVSAQSGTFEQALATARTEHKAVLLRFSGSDWCIPCIRMEKEVFGDSVVSRYTAAHLVSVQADFPRQKKHQLPHERQLANEALAERFNPNGSFPLLVLLNGDGKVLGRWEAAVTDKAAFVAELERRCANL